MKKLLLFLTLILLITTSPVHGQDAVTNLLTRINTLRASLGLSPYTYHSALAAAAQNHAQYMVDNGSISHTQANGSTPSTRAAAAGYPSSFVSENIYGGTNATANDAWNFWMNSPIHYRGITNPNYTEIGIGVATSSWGRAFVLVFGSQGNTYSAPPARQGGTNNNGVKAPPSFIVGQDSVGNILHEIQPGQTLGEIALIYGYTWSDIPYMLQINEMTQDDIRRLKEGAVFLVPPHSGTFTPTPLPEGWPTLTPYVEPTIDNSAGVWTAIAEQGLFTTITLTLTPSPDITATEEIIQQPTHTEVPTEITNDDPPYIATANTVPEFLLVQPTVTPHIVAVVSTPSQEREPSQVVVIRDNTSQWVIAAVVLQSLLLVGASFEFVRRSRRK